MTQLSYTLQTEVAVAGMQADLNPSEINSYNATEAMDFGLMVAKVAGDDDGIALPTGASDVLVGGTVRDLTKVSGDYQLGDTAGIMKKGKLYFKVEVAVTPDDDVFVRFASGSGGTTLGILRTDADTATAVQVTNARFMTSADAGGFAVVDLNLV